MSDQEQTLIQRTAKTLYESIKGSIGDAKNFADKPSAALFTAILTRAATAVEGYKTNGKKLSSAEKQALAIEIGRLFVIDLKGKDSQELKDYDILAVPTLDLLIGFSNELVELGGKIKKHCANLGCFKNCK